nr:MAG TPA: hypothetical protein [Caudoviricetes sp.]
MKILKELYPEVRRIKVIYSVPEEAHLYYIIRRVTHYYVPLILLKVGES